MGLRAVSVADAFAAADAAASAGGGMRAGPAARSTAGIAARPAAGSGRAGDAAKHIDAAADRFANAGSDAVDAMADFVYPVSAAARAAPATITLIHPGESSFHLATTQKAIRVLTSEAGPSSPYYMPPDENAIQEERERFTPRSPPRSLWYIPARRW